MRLRTRLILGVVLFVAFAALLVPNVSPDAAPVARWRGYRITRQEPHKPVDPAQTAMVAGIRVNKDVVPNVRALMKAAEGDGVQLRGSGYRSVDEQARLRRVNGCPDVWTSASSMCRVPTAIPGRSQHESGMAIDFENCATHDTVAYRWLSKNAARFGFYNLESEPWHWSTSGR